jgi:hypothetical protein
MTDRSAAMAAWTAAGTQLVMLPSSVEVRVDLPSIPALIASGQMPGYLRSMAMKVVGSEEIDPAALTDEDRERWDEFERLLISQTVVAFKPPGMDEQPGRITMDDLKADPCPIPRDDLLAIRNMALRIQTPAMVDAMSRLVAMHTDLRLAIEAGLDDPDEIGQREAAIKAKGDEVDDIVRREAVNTLEGWASFRRLGGRAAAGVTGEDVGSEAIQPRDHLGPMGRPRVRRRAEPETDARQKPEPKRRKRRAPSGDKVRVEGRPQTPAD